MPLGSVAAYQAALESTNTAMSYAMESTWSTAPATTFQAMRLISESLAHKKTRVRPGEVRGDRQAAAPITTQESASGSIVMPVFFNNSLNTTTAAPFDDLLTAVLGNDWQPPGNIVAVGGDIALSAAGVISSPTAGKFAGVLIGQVIKLRGFTNAVNNGFYRVLAGSTATSLVTAPMGFVPVAETPPGTFAVLWLSGTRNALAFKSIYLQQRLDIAGTKWFRYPGAYPTKLAMQLNAGQFLQATVDLAAQQELKGLVDISQGGILPAPSTRDMDPVSGFKGVFWNDQPLNAGVISCGTTISNEGAAGEYFLGSAMAQGMLGGTLMATAAMELAFRDFTYYDMFRAETQGVLAIRFGDVAGNSYVFTFPNATLMFDSGVNMSGPNKMLTSPVTVEASPDLASGATVLVDRFPAAV